MISFVLPSPPPLNNLFFNVAGRGRVRTERYRAWAYAAGWAMRLDNGRVRTWETINGPVAIELVVGDTRADLDGLAKAPIDLLVSQRVIDDDKQVIDLHITRGGKAKEAIVTVREI